MVEPPLEVVSPLEMGVVAVWGVGALDAIVLRVEAVIGSTSW